MKILGLIGYPLTHSYSPAYFSKKFANEGIDNFTYQLFPLRSIEELPELLEKEPHLIGFNVTIPYKSAIIPYLHTLSEEARKIGAVNTVFVNREKLSLHLMGHNTDAPAFEYTLKEILPSTAIKALILGSGGVARAVIYTLTQMGIDYDIVSRNKANGITHTYETLTQQIIAEHQLIINCTPLGMYPETHKCPFLPYNALTHNHIVYDLIYNPQETLLLKKARAQGAFCKNGLDMLHRQADLAWKFWQKALNNSENMPHP